MRAATLLVWCSYLLSPGHFIFAQDSKTDLLDTQKRISTLRGQGTNSTFQYQQNQDIGPLEWVERYTPPPTFTVSTFQGVYYTDNAYLSRHDQSGSAVWNGMFSGTVVPWSTYHWTPSVSLEHYMFRHASASANDYDADIVTAASDLALNEARSIWWRASYSLWRFYSAHGNSSEYLKFGEVESRLTFSQQLLRELSLYEAAGFRWRHAHPSYFDRLNPFLEAGLDYQLFGNFHLVPVVRPEGRFYTRNAGVVTHRKDFFLVSSVSLLWSPSKYVQLAASYLWSANFSTFHDLDYQENRALFGIYGTISF